jgi:hypothetical protein
MVTALVMLIPLLGNTFVDGWNWPLRAFVVAGLLVFSFALAHAHLTRNSGQIAYRTAVGIALVTTFVLMWGNLVQGADDINPHANLYFWVPLIELGGAAIARFRPRGMARALFVTALAQAVVVTIVLIIRDPQAMPWTAPVLRGFAGNTLFAMAFLASALLFRKASRDERVSPA